MTEYQVRALGPALDRFLQPLLFCCFYTQTFEHLRTYCRGLLSDLPRKNVEAIALAAGTPVRTLQEFLRDHGWNHAKMIDTTQKNTASLLPSLPTDEDDIGTVGIIDETGIPKKGTMTPGVQRQWCGRLGKVENCVVTVHLGVARGRFTALLDGQLYLPKAWDDDRERCRRAGIPDEVVYRPKWQIALDELRRAKSNGLSFDWLTFDEEYGKRPAFLAGLEVQKQRFVGEVPRTLACRADEDGLCPETVDPSAPADRVLVPALTGSGIAVRVRHHSSADEVWQAVERVVWLRDGNGWSTRSYRLIGAFNARTGEVKYFVSNAPAEVSLACVVRAAFRRAPVEHGFAIGKGELGLDHYEGRSYTGMMRHVAVCCLLSLFVATRAAESQKKTRK